MKISDVSEVQDIGRQLDANKELRDWLDSFPEKGLYLGTNGIAIADCIRLKRETSFEFLEKHKQGCLNRLKELGVEE